MQFNFMSQFAEAVETYKKPFTIRNKRKQEGSIGETVHLFTGQRTKACRKLGMAPLAFQAEIVLTKDGFLFPATEMNSQERVEHNKRVKEWLRGLNVPEITSWLELYFDYEDLGIKDFTSERKAANEAFAKLDGFGSWKELMQYHSPGWSRAVKWLYAWENPNHHKYLSI